MDQMEARCQPSNPLESLPNHLAQWSCEGLFLDRWHLFGDSHGHLRHQDRQHFAAGGSVFGSSHRNLEPCNGLVRDEFVVGGGITWITWPT